MNKPWFVSAHTTAAGIALEYTDKNVRTSVAQYGAGQVTYRLRGFAVSGSTAIAISTTPITLIYGNSSLSPQTTLAITNEPGIGMVGANDLMGLEGGYFALETTVAHAHGGLTFLMWGD